MQEAGDELLGGLAVLLLENGDDSSRLGAVADSFVASGLRLLYISREWQQAACGAALLAATAATAATAPQQHCDDDASAAAGVRPLPEATTDPPGAPPAAAAAAAPPLPVDLAQQVVGAATGALLPIGVTRTLLQLFMAEYIQAEVPACVRPMCLAWILDDDKRLPRLPPIAGSRPRQDAAAACGSGSSSLSPVLITGSSASSGCGGGGGGTGNASGGTGSAGSEAQSLVVPSLDLSFLRVLQAVKHAGVTDVLLGVDEGAPPLPAASCLRMGLLDLASNLQVRWLPCVRACACVCVRVCVRDPGNDTDAVAHTAMVCTGTRAPAAPRQLARHQACVTHACGD